MKKKADKKSIFENKRAVLIISLVLGFFCWIVVAGFINNSTNTNISNVTIDYQKRAEDYTRNDLLITTDTTKLQYATVRIQGESSLIGSFTNTDVSVYLDFSAVNGPGTYRVPLRTERVTSGSYDIIGATLAGSNQTYVELTFEQISTKTLPITVEADGVTAASGYFRDSSTTSMADAIVSGPASEVSRVSALVARINDDIERDETVIYNTVPLEPVDADGNVIQSSLLTIGPSESVEVTIPILEMRTLGLTIDIIGMQQGFDTDWLMERLSLSTESITVVGATGTLTNIQSPYPVTEFDISEFGMGWISEEIDITLPEGVKSENSPKQLTVSFDSSGLVEKTFEVTNFNVKNTPKNATIEPVPEGITVTLIGPAEQIEALLPENLTIEIDAFSISTSRGNQQTIPGRVVIPSANRVFATGSYPIVCDIEVS